MADFILWRIRCLTPWQQEIAPCPDGHPSCTALFTEMNYHNEAVSFTCGHVDNLSCIIKSTGRLIQFAFSIRLKV
jgi:hypothetical protein